MSKVANNLQKILDDHALSQEDLRKITKLSKGLVNKTCLQKISPRPKNQALLVNGLNQILEERNFSERYVLKDIFK